MAPENQMPRLNPKSIDAPIKARATMNPTLIMPPRKLKSFLVVKAITVRAMKSPPVAIAACAMALLALRLAIKRRGRMTMDSPTTKRLSPAY